MPQLYNIKANLISIVVSCPPIIITVLLKILFLSYKLVIDSHSFIRTLLLDNQMCTILSLLVTDKLTYTSILIKDEMRTCIQKIYECPNADFYPGTKIWTHSSHSPLLRVTETNKHTNKPILSGLNPSLTWELSICYDLAYGRLYPYVWYL